MDNFKSQITSSVTDLLESNDIHVHVCMLPPNTTDSLQPMHLSVNKPGKDFLKWCFEDWDSEQVTKKLKGRDVESTELAAVSLGLPILKELGAKWMVQVAEYFADNPQIIVNGFIWAGITRALDGLSDDKEGEPNSSDNNESESDFELEDND